MSSPGWLSSHLLLDIFLNHLTPIFFSAGIGYLFGRLFQPDLKTLARVAFYIFSPCLVFTGLTQAELGGPALWRMVGFTISAVAISGILAWIAARIFRFNRSLPGALMLTGMFVNGGNYGLPLNFFAFGEAGLANALIYFSTSTVLIYSVGVFIASWIQLPSATLQVEKRGELL